MSSAKTSNTVKVSATVGASLFEKKVWVEESKGRKYTDFSEFYQPREASLRGIVNWIIEDQSTNPEKVPGCNHAGGMDEVWDLTDPQEFLEYFASHTDEQIIDEFFLVEDDRDWSIEEVKVSPLEERKIQSFLYFLV